MKVRIFSSSVKVYLSGECGPAGCWRFFENELRIREKDYYIMFFVNKYEC